MKHETADATFVLGPIAVLMAFRALEELALRGIVDAVVSSGDSMLSMGGSVSAAIPAAAGSEIP